MPGTQRGVGAKRCGRSLGLGAATTMGGSSMGVRPKAPRRRVRVLLGFGNRRIAVAVQRTYHHRDRRSALIADGTGPRAALLEAFMGRRV
jgi:hypothetical protein